jgi:bifunctional DNA-binding transcriptional regulator/antitoxin component of YhaV-PrlF toxin-antitoxin module
MIRFMIMKRVKVTTGGQISVPAEIRRRWATTTLTLEDLGDRIVLSPAPDDPIGAARGALAGKAGTATEELRRAARAAEAIADERRVARR